MIQPSRQIPRCPSVWFVLLCGAALLPGCGWLRQTRPAADANVEASTAPPPSPYIPPAIARTLGKTTDSLQTGEARAVSPATLGDAARLGVGRTFAPVRFAPEDTEVDAAGRRQLVEYAGWFRANPHVWVVLAGHAAPHGSDRYQLGISMARAIAVREFLVNQGLDGRKFYPIGYGAEVGPPPDPSGAERVELIGFVAPPNVELPPPVPNAPPPPEPEEVAGNAPTPDQP